MFNNKSKNNKFSRVFNIYTYKKYFDFIVNIQKYLIKIYIIFDKMNELEK